MKTGDNVRLRADGRYEARYHKGRDNKGKIKYGYCYGNTREEAEAKREEMKAIYQTPQSLNLLILGAGVHGLDVYEIASSFRIFNKISFLDDDLTIENTLGTCTEFEKYINEYSVAIPAIGDNLIRSKWMEELTIAGFLIPTLIHRSSNVSVTSSVGLGTVICAGASVGAKAKIGQGCIIDAGAIVERGAIVPDWTLVECGSVYKAIEGRK